MADPISITTVPKQQLVELINQDNQMQLTLADVSLSDPVAGNFEFPQTDGSIKIRNAKVTVTATDTSEYVGTKDVFYNRLALSDLGQVGIISSSPITSDQLLQIITSRKGIQMLADEFETILLPVLAVGATGRINLVAKATAVKWYGTLQVDYAFNLPPEMDILDHLINVILPSYNLLG